MSERENAVGKNFDQVDPSMAQADGNVQPSFPPMVPLDAIKNLIAEVRAGNFSVKTMTDCVWIIGCLLASLGGIPLSQVSQAMTDGPPEFDTPEAHCCELEDVCNSCAGDSSKSISPDTIFSIIKLILGFLPLFLNKPPVTPS